MLSSRFKAPLKLDSDEITARHWWDYGSWLTRLRLVTGEVTACAPRDYGSCLCGVLIRLFHIIQPLFHKKVPLFENIPALFENNPVLLKTNRHLLKRRCESRGHESQGRSLISPNDQSPVPVISLTESPGVIFTSSMVRWFTTTTTIRLVIVQLTPLATPLVSPNASRCCLRSSHERFLLRPLE